MFVTPIFNDNFIEGVEKRIKKRDKRFKKRVKKILKKLKNTEQ